MICPGADKLDAMESKYALVIVAAKRARQIKDGARRMTDTRSTNPLTVALEEISNGDIKYVQVGECKGAPGCVLCGYGPCPFNKMVVKPGELSLSIASAPVLMGLNSSLDDEDGHEPSAAEIGALLSAGEDMMSAFDAETGLLRDDDEEAIDDVLVGSGDSDYVLPLTDVLDPPTAGILPVNDDLIEEDDTDGEEEE